MGSKYKAGVSDYSKGVKKPDFLNWFPNTNDLRVLDWLGAEEEVLTLLALLAQKYRY